MPVSAAGLAKLQDGDPDDWGPDESTTT